MLLTGGRYQLALGLYLLGAVLLGELVIRPVLALTLSDIFFLAALTALIVEGIIRSTPPTLRLPPSFVVGGVLFTIGGLVSSFYSSQRGQSMAELARLDYVLLVWIWMGPQIIRSTAHLALAVRLWTISAGVAGTGALIQLVFGDVIPNTHSSWGRMTGLTQHVNDLGGLTAIALVPSLMFATTARFGRSLRLVGVATSALILSGLILSGSVAGFAAAAAAVLGWLLMRRPDRRLVLAIGLLILAGLGSVALQAVRNGVSPAARLTNVLGGAGDRSSGHTRLEIDLAALQQIATHPILGVGLNNESYVRATGDLVHNVLLEVWLGGGTVALIGFVIMLAAVAYSGFRNVRELVDEERDLATSTFAAFCGLLVFGLAAPVLLSRYAWMPVAMLVILRQLRIQSNLLPATTKKSGDSDRA